MQGRVFLCWTSAKLGLMCLAQGHNAVTPVRFEPAAPPSRVKHSTTEPLRSKICICDYFCYWKKNIFSLMKYSWHIIVWNFFVCLFDLILYVPSTIFQLYRVGSSWVEPVLSKDKCVLLKDHNAVTPVRLEPAALRSRVKHSTTEPLRSQICICDYFLLLKEKSILVDEISLAHKCLELIASASI